MILTAIINTPLGEMVAGVTAEGLCLLEFTDKARYKKIIDNLCIIFKTGYHAGENSHTREARKEIEEYFKGVRREFDVPLVIEGTEFQECVWKELLKIPFGSTRSYRELAEAIDKPGSVRAVAGANGINRIAIIIPCHRVIGADGSLTGYTGGLTRKKWLIDHERRYSGKEVWIEGELDMK